MYDSTCHCIVYFFMLHRSSDDRENGQSLLLSSVESLVVIDCVLSCFSLSTPTFHAVEFLLEASLGAKVSRLPELRQLVMYQWMTDRPEVPVRFQWVLSQ